jgi:hypothetical protein
MRGRTVEVVPVAVVHGQIRGQIRELAVVVVEIEMDAGRSGQVLRAPEWFFPRPGQPAMTKTAGGGVVA